MRVSWGKGTLAKVTPASGWRLGRLLHLRQELHSSSLRWELWRVSQPGSKVLYRARGKLPVIAGIAWEVGRVLPLGSNESWYWGAGHRCLKTWEKQLTPSLSLKKRRYYNFAHNFKGFTYTLSKLISAFPAHLEKQKGVQMHLYLLTWGQRDPQTGSLSSETATIWKVYFMFKWQRGRGETLQGDFVGWGACTGDLGLMTSL